MKTFVGNLFAVSTLTAFIATNVPSVSAVALSDVSHVARHLNHAHVARSKRHAHTKRCTRRAALPAADSGNGGGSSPNNGGSTENKGASTDNNSGSTDNNGGTNNNGGSNNNNGGSTNNNSGSGGSPASYGSGVGSWLFPQKKGLAFPNGCNYLTQWSPDIIGWQYNWRANPYGDCPGGVPKYIPMVWGWPQVEDFRAATNQNHPDVIFCLNEPNLCNDDGSNYSACVSAQDGARIWNDVVRPLRDRGTKIGSSATTNDPVSGIQWEKDFRQALGERGSDFLTLHYYGLNFQGFLDYVNLWSNAFPGEQMVFTEVGCQNFGDQSLGQCDWNMVQDFITSLGHWCATQDICLGWTWFGAMQNMQNVNTLNQLMDSDYNPSPMGRTFLAS